MSETSSRRRGSEPRTRFDDSRRKGFLAALVIGGVLIVLAVAGIEVSRLNPDLGLTLQLGGISRARDVLPRNFRLWAIQPDGKLRFATAFFPVRTNAPASEVFTVAGPLVDHPEDMLETMYFGALNINTKIQNGQNNDSNRFYNLYWVEHDPAVAAYGVDVMTQKPPYVSVDAQDTSLRDVAMGAPQQTYYAQVTVAIAFPPGTVIKNVAYPLPTTGTAVSTENMLTPYRRVTISGWIVYYFDQTSLTLPSTVRIRYAPSKTPNDLVSELDLWDADRQR